MSQRLIVLDEAEEELIEAENWYERQRPGLGREFRAVIDEGMERLVQAPLAASPIANIPAFVGARRILVKRFPYSIVFIEHGEDLWVVAFAHQHRRPGYWRERLQP
jgi:plasmid stabilization system protein ParE